VKISKSDLTKIIKEEILREMIDNNRLSAIRAALASNQPMPFELQPYEKEYVRGQWEATRQATLNNLLSSEEKNLEDLNLNGTNFKRADLKGKTLKNLRLQGANLSGVDLRGATLTNLDLTGADLTGADMRGATKKKLDLRGANLTGVIGLKGRGDWEIIYNNETTFSEDMYADKHARRLGLPAVGRNWEKR
jgi:hypothetical protein